MLAFLKTTWSVTTQPSHFCREIARPVSLGDARRFRRVVVVLIWLSAIGTIINDAWVPGWLNSNSDFVRFLNEEMHLPSGVAAAGTALLLLLLFIGGTGLHLYWLHPKSLPIELQNRSVALGHYACAPLAWLAIFSVLNAIGSAIETAGINANDADLRGIGQSIWGIATCMAAVSVFLFWRNTWIFARKTAQRGGLGQIALAVTLPLLWIAWLVVVMAVIPLAIGFVAMVIYAW